jgi:UV DNA damage endonuclease
MLSILRSLHRSRVSKDSIVCTRPFTYTSQRHPPPTLIKSLAMAPKRKHSTVASATDSSSTIQHPPILPPGAAPRPASHNGDIVDGPTALRASPDADEPGEYLDVKKIIEPHITPAKTNGVKKENGVDEVEPEINGSTKKPKKTPTKTALSAKKGSDEIKAFKAEQAARKAAEKAELAKVKKEEDVDEWDLRQDPDGDDAAPAEDADALRDEGRRPPPVNSDYLPLPWKGRLGYVGIACSS